MAINLLKPFTTPRPITVPVKASQLERGDVIALEETCTVLGEVTKVQQPYVITAAYSAAGLIHVTLDTGRQLIWSPSVRVPVVTG